MGFSGFDVDLMGIHQPRLVGSEDFLGYTWEI
jgi:hypothetical protein